MAMPSVKPHFSDSTVADDREQLAANVAKMVSAIEGVEEQDMTTEELAATDFTAWIYEKDEWTPPSNIEWAELANPHLIMVRVAWHMLHKSKAELIEMVERMSREESDENFLISTLDSLHNTVDWFRGMLSMCDAAVSRLVVAGLNATDVSAN